MKDSKDESLSGIPIEATMSAILATMFAILIGLHQIQIPLRSSSKIKSNDNSQNLQQPLRTEKSMLQICLPDPILEPTKYCYEMFVWTYTPFWISAFALIIISQCYEHFTAWSYLIVCGGLALPLLLQPIFYPQGIATSTSNCNSDGLVDINITNPDTVRKLSQRYSLKANLWISTYSFIGNYWYTHYFYSVLHAEYTMPSHRFNDVPIAMTCATHFYFCTYHVFSNCCLRFIDRNYAEHEGDSKNDTISSGTKRGWRKQILFWYTILFLSYFTAFMETLTISSFPYYSFDDRYMAYVYGSAFYGIYFIVSFPAFYYFDQHIDDNIRRNATNDNMNGSEATTGNGACNARNDETKPQFRPLTIWDSFVSSCGHGMMILTLLDFVRLYLGIPLVIGGVAFAST